MSDANYAEFRRRFKSIHGEYLHSIPELMGLKVVRATLANSGIRQSMTQADPVAVEGAVMRLDL